MLDKKLHLPEVTIPTFLTPRLTVVITTINAKGQVNAAPFSFFTPISYFPPRVCFSVTFYKHNDLVYFEAGGKEPSSVEVLKLEEYAKETGNTHKDTLFNVMEQGEFGVNILPIEYLHQVQITAGIFPYGINEIEMAGLTPYPSTKIKPPLIKEAKVGLECVKVADYNVDPSRYWNTLIIGEGVAVHVDSTIMKGDEIEHERVRSILELSHSVYGLCTDFRYEEYIRYADTITMLRTSS